MGNYRFKCSKDKETHTLYQTDIVTIDNETVTLNCGGYWTKTTQKYMNKALSDLKARIKVNKGNWFLVTSKGYAIEFTDRQLVVPMDKF